MADSGIKASDIMTKEVVIANSEMTAAEAAGLMNRFRIGGMPVLEEGILVGMLTERDIMKGIVEPNKLPGEIKVSEIMTSPPKIFCTEHEDMRSVVKKMAKFNVTRIPIVDSASKLRGIVTNKDVLQNCGEFIDILLEQAKIKGMKEDDYTAFGYCELCGDSSHLTFKEDKFICDNCSRKN